MRIRKAKPQDAQRVMELFNSEANLKLVDDDFYDLADINGYMKDRSGRLFVAEEEGQVLGVFYMQVYPGYINLDNIVVNPTNRKNGVGRRLMDYIERYAQKRKKYSIEMIVEENNSAMRALVERRGYDEGKRFVAYSKKIK